MSSTKTIQVNRDFLSLNSHSVKKDARIKSKKGLSKTLTSPNKMRKEFLKKIKDFQSKRLAGLNTGDTIEKTPDEKEFEQEFNKSLMFLQNIKNIKDSDVKPPPIIKGVEVSVVLPSSFDEHAPLKPTVRSSIENTESITIQPYKSLVKLPPRPLYSSLKNSVKPTYREWVKTQKISPVTKPCNVISEETTKPTYKKDKLYDKIKIKRMTKTIKRVLGKTGNKVSVLIKSRQTRRRIQGEQSKLNQTSIHDIKKYLRDRNLIKVGSNSPNDVIRKLYEQCILTGDVTNNSEKILIHNFINDKNV